MQEAALEVLYFLDGLEERRRRRDMMLSSAVASRVITAVQAFPDLFDAPDAGDPGAFPSRDADTSSFQLEPATPDSFQADIEAMVRASQQVSLREEELPPLPQFPGMLPDIEWT